MKRRAAAELVRFLEQRAKPHLRGVVAYDDETYELLYLRADVKQVRLASEVERIVERLR